MTEDLQLAQHLEADTLSAFAEGALPPHEREAALAHLAICGECREIVQLAIPPFEEAQTILRPARTGWRWLWAGAAACTAAALISVALFRHPATSAPPQPMARVELPPPISAANLAPVTPQVSQSLPVVAPRPALKPAPSGAPAADHRAAPAAVSPYLQAGNAQPQQPSVEAKSQPQAALTVDGSLNGTLNQPTAAAAPLASQRYRAASGIGMNGQPPAAFGAASGGIAPAPPASALSKSAPPVASQTVQVEANAILLDSTNASLAQLLPELPSHLATASRYAQGKRVVAADTAGTVFFSKDAGHHWSAAKVAWSGHVVRVGAPDEVALPPRSTGPIQADAKAGTATLQGTVTDPSGAVIPAASITLTGTASLHVLANPAGRYSLRGLAAGPYTLRVETTGFLTTERKLTLSATQQLTVDIVLMLGAVSETVTVEVSPAAIAEAKRKAPAFALMTDAGQRWVSVDGKKWTQQ